MGVVAAKNGVIEEDVKQIENEDIEKEKLLRDEENEVEKQEEKSKLKKF